MGNTTNSSVDSTTIAHVRNVIVSLADEGATAIGLDECGDLNGPRWGHIPGEIPGLCTGVLAHANTYHVANP